MGILEWSEFCIRNENKVTRGPDFMDKNSLELPLLLSVYGGTGLTAVLSLKTIDEQNIPREGKKKTLVVSSAAGSTGSYII